LGITGDGGIRPHGSSAFLAVKSDQNGSDDLVTASPMTCVTQDQNDLKRNSRDGGLRDFQIRSALRERLHLLHATEPDTAIIEELSLCQGDARVDVAVVNGSFSGYEIKSDRDTLARLPNQLAAYELCFDTMTIVVGLRHVKECMETLPQWWGIWEAVATEDGVKFGCWREAAPNHRIAPARVVQLLWKNEAREALQQIGVKPPSKSSRRDLWAMLLAAVPPQELFQIVRSRIRARGDWRSAPTPFRCGDSSQSFAKSQRSRENRRWLLSALSRHRPS